MNASEIKFGIEIECFIPARNWGSRPIGSYHGGVQVADLPTGWKAESDGSLHTSRRRMVAVEIVSPILQGADGIAQIKLVCAWLAQLGATVNPTCGFHVTIGYPRDIKALRKLIHAVARHEKALYAVTGSRRREESQYARPMKEAFRALEGVRNLACVTRCFAAACRYYALNLTHVLRGTDRVEFRVFQGTVNVIKIIGIVELCLGLATKALSEPKTPKWDLVPKAIRQGAGKKALFCLTRSLKWDAHNKSGIGVLDSETFDDVLDILRKMAAKYDGNVTDTDNTELAN